jgi:hypothetical protein
MRAYNILPAFGGRGFLPQQESFRTHHSQDK